MNKRFRTITILSVLAASTMVFTGCGTDLPANASEQQIPSVKTITLSSVERGLIGKVVVNETVEIYSKQPGRIASILVEEGAKVKKGDLLVQLETSELEVQVRKAQAGLDAAQAQLANTLEGARQEDIRAVQGALDAALSLVDQSKAAFDQIQITYNQARNHYDMGNITKDELELATTNYKTAKSAYDAAVANARSAQAKLDLLKAGAAASTIDQLRAQVAAAQADLDSANLMLRNASIVSPIDGIVVKKYAKAGEMAFTAMPSGASLLQLISLDPAKVEVSVPESEVNQIKEGDSIDIQVASLPDKKFQGTVSFVSPVSDPNNNTFTVRLTVPNPENLLRAGNVVTVNFTADAAKRVEIPRDSIIEKDGKKLVYKLDGDQVREIAVTTEDKNKDWVFVENSSLFHHEDKIVISPPASLSDGTKVVVE
ncbi:efflux RND transporter periplasmic adaptor subunit [Paenibacillus naphthalenovorans]|uniref:efflux RND transporter periplasmic adaptor subunit n=1 Tax=Paenibacillus naphthalenovorans TaxID=162209 RepID=UPI003D2E6C8D